MPKVPVYTLTWSSARETYELYQTRDREVLRIAAEGPAWFAWLDQVSSFAFVGKCGRYRHARKPGSVAIATGTPTWQRASTSAKSTWARRLPSS
jgi:hypothetical protein